MTRRELACDAVILGGGLAGLAAGIRLRELGRDPIILEAQTGETYANNTRWGGGVFHLAFRSVVAPPEELTQRTIDMSQGFVPQDLAQIMGQDSKRATEWLQGHGVEFVSMDPDEGWRDYVLAPLGYHDKPGLHWEGSGSDVMMRRLVTQYRSVGGQMIQGAVATELLRDGDGCHGLIAKTEDEELRIEAVAVILADGGFQGNPDLLRRFVTPHPDRMLQRGPGVSNGTGIQLAEGAGAALIGMEYIYAHTLSADALHNDALWPFPFLDFVSAAGMMVDTKGQRFVDEGQNFVYLSNGIAHHDEADPPYAIFDEAIWQEAGRHFFWPPNPNLKEQGGTLHQADNIADLAARAGLPSDMLQKTVTAYNDALAGDRLATLTPTRNNAKADARPIAEPPFYAAPACVGLTHTMGGVQIDTEGRALRSDGTAIAGLFAAGDVTGGLEGGPAVAYIGGLQQALIFGLRSAETIAAKESP